MKFDCMVDLFNFMKLDVGVKKQSCGLRKLINKPASFYTQQYIFCVMFVVVLSESMVFHSIISKNS